MRTLGLLFFSMFFVSTLNISTAKAQNKEWITIEGIAPLGPDSENLALRDAMRKAIQQVLGVMVESQTLVENFQVISDKILTASQGYVSDYKIVSSGLEPSKEVYKVIIQAKVKRKAILDDIRGLKIFINTKLDNKHLMIIYHKRSNGLDRKNKAVKSAQNSIRNYFLKKQFRVFNEDAVTPIYEKIKELGEDFSDKKLNQLAINQDAELLIKFSLSSRTKPGPTFSIVIATVTTKVFNPSTGKILGSSEKSTKQIYPSNNNLAFEEALIKASVQAAKSTSSSIVEMILTNLSISDTKEFLIIFKNFEEKEMDQIYSLVKSIGFRKFRELRFEPYFLELEIFEDIESTSNIRRILKNALENKGLLLETLETSGNRIIFKRKKS